MHVDLGRGEVRTPEGLLAGAIITRVARAPFQVLICARRPAGARLRPPSRYHAVEVVVVRRVSVAVLCLVVIGFVATVVASGQSWIRSFEGPNYGALFALHLAPDGTILAVGATNHLHVPPYTGDVLLMAVSLDGSVLWERAWGGSGYDQAVSIEPAPEGGYYVFGETDSYGAGNRDFFLLKIDTDGQNEWFRTYGGSGREWPYGMLRLGNGDLLLYGFRETSTGGRRQQYAVRVSRAGDVVWEYLHGEAPEEIVLDALETGDGSLVLCVLFDEDGGIVKLGPGGNVLWSRRFTLPGWQYASHVVAARDGFFLAGFAMGPGRQADIWLARCSVEGDLDWQTAIGDPRSDDYATALLALLDGTYVIGALGDGMPLLRIDGSGGIIWRRHLADGRVHLVSDLIQLPDGGFLAGGLVQIVGGRSYDAVLVRTDKDGRVDGP